LQASKVWNEHLVARLDPFRAFLEVAAQSSGQLVNMAAIARDVGVDDKTVAS
jgi:predicted AAA+ superfamily ATPase